MIQLTENYTWKQTAAMSKFKKLGVKLKIIAFAIDGKIDDIYILSQRAAMDGMKCFDKRMNQKWINKFFQRDSSYKIYREPVGTPISFDEFVGLDYINDTLNYQNYGDCDLAYVLLEPPYGLNLKFYHNYGTPEYYDEKRREYSAIYEMFLNYFILLSEYKKDDLIIYSWSDDWSNFFDAGKDWWGTYYCTVYNKQNNTIIVLGASETD